jgi:hypothetical protein
MLGNEPKGVGWQPRVVSGPRGLRQQALQVIERHFALHKPSDLVPDF